MSYEIINSDCLRAMQELNEGHFSDLRSTMLQQDVQARLPAPEDLQGVP